LNFPRMRAVQDYGWLRSVDEVMTPLSRVRVRREFVQRRLQRLLGELEGGLTHF
jgi:hypothetical protein